MTSAFAPPGEEEELFDVYGNGNDFQYSNFEYNPNDANTRKGRSSVPNYMKPTRSSASRERAKSADSRSRSRSRTRGTVQPTKSYEDRLLDELLQQQFDHDVNVQRLPQQQQQQETTNNNHYTGPQMQLSTQDGDHFMDPNFGEPMERIHFERETNNNPFAGGAADSEVMEAPPRQPQHLQQDDGNFDPFGGEWSAEDDKRRWDMPYDPSPTYPTPTNATTTATSTQPKVQATKSFPSSSQYITPTNRQEQQKVQSAKSFPSTSSQGKSIGAQSNTTASQQSGGGDWKTNMMKSTMVLKPKTKAVKDQVKAITNRLSSAMSRSSRSSQIPSVRSSHQRSKSQPAPERRNHRGQPIADSGIVRQNNNPVPKQQYQQQQQPTPSNNKSKGDYGSFELEYDFYGDGFAQSQSQQHHDDNAAADHGFQVISQRRKPKAEYPNGQQQHFKPDVVAPTYTSKRPPPVSYADYLANSKIPSAKGAFSKISPTSVMDVNNHSNVHWSKDLSQAPTPRAVEDNPQSILRGTYPGQNNNDYQVGHAVTSARTQVDFRDEISPIKHQSSPVPYHHHETQRASTNSAMDESDMMSVAYNEFIESVAAVVIQTTIRRYMAKIQVDKIRVQLAAARKYRYNRKRIEGKSSSKSSKSAAARSAQELQEQRRIQEQRRLQQEAMANARMEYQLFDFAAIRIQSVFRGWFVRDILKIEHYCATIIQKNVRAFLYRNQYQYDLFRIIIAQSVVRRFLVCRNLYIAPDPEVRRVLDFAATMIQARWRGYAAEMRYFQDYCHVLIAQSVVRRWLAIRQVKAMHTGARNSKKVTNRFGKYGAGRRSFGNHLPQQTTTSKWSNTRNVPWKPASSSNNNQVRRSVSNDETRSKEELPSGMSSVAKRRAMFESKRLDTVQQEEQDRERVAAEKAELKAMQRRMGVKTSPATSTSAQPQRAKSFSGRIQSQPTKKWGSDVGSNNTKQVGRTSFESNSVVASDAQTEVQSNRTSTSRLLQGWRDREKSNSFDQRRASFDMASDRPKEMYNNQGQRSSAAGLSKYLGGQENTASSSSGTGVAKQAPSTKEQKNGEPSVQEIMRSKRSPTESARIERMEEIFQRVGLMPAVNRPRADDANQEDQPPSEPAVQKQQASPLRKVNNTMQNAAQPQWIVQPSRSLGDSPQTKRKLFHDEPDDSGKDEKAALKVWRNNRQPLRGSTNRAPLPPRQQQSNWAERRSMSAPSPVDDRSKNLMNSLGMNTSYASEASTDMSDMENSPSPAFMRRFQKPPSSPTVVKANLFGAQPQQNAPTPARPVFSEFQLQKQGERSQQEQSRIDGFHAIFEKVGLMQSVA